MNHLGSAAGKEGFLLIYPDMSTAEPMPDKDGRKMVKCRDTIVAFRIYEYDENGKHKKDEEGHTLFTDYKILHYDLKIKLLDGAFYEKDGDYYIDYEQERTHVGRTKKAGN